MKKKRYWCPNQCGKKVSSEGYGRYTTYACTQCYAEWQKTELQHVQNNKKMTETPRQLALRKAKEHQHALQSTTKPLIPYPNNQVHRIALVKTT